LAPTSTMCACPAPSKWVKWAARAPGVRRGGARVPRVAADAIVLGTLLRATTDSPSVNFG
jgi:hypothetical protein